MRINQETLYASIVIPGTVIACLLAALLPWALR